MSRDNWERLVTAVVRRERLRQLFHDHSRTPSISSISSEDPDFADNILRPLLLSRNKYVSQAAIKEAVEMAASVILNGRPLLHRLLEDYNWLLEEFNWIDQKLSYIRAYLDDAEPHMVLPGLGAATTRLIKYSGDLADDMGDFVETYLLKISSNSFDGLLKRMIFVLRYSRARSKLSAQIEKMRWTIQKIDEEMKIYGTVKDNITTGENGTQAADQTVTLILSFG